MPGKLKDLVHGHFEACKSRVADTMEKAKEIMESENVTGITSSLPGCDLANMTEKRQNNISFQ